MTSCLWIRSLRSALIGHLAAAVIMVFLTWLSLFLESPSSAILPIALVSLGSGAFVSALSVRKQNLGLSGALLSGGIFILPLCMTSCFGEGSVFSFGTRLLLLLATVAIVLTVVLLFPKRKKRRKPSFYAKRR